MKRSCTMTGPVLQIWKGPVPWHQGACISVRKGNFFILICELFCTTHECFNGSMHNSLRVEVGREQWGRQEGTKMWWLVQLMKSSR